MKRFLFASLAAVSAFAATQAPAQRDPAYQAARASGAIGELPDGYLGVVGAGTPELKRLADSINIQRKSIYTKSAAAGATVEQFAFTSGCNLILQTAPGEKYKGPDGAWHTRTAAPPLRDPRCV